MLSHTSTHMRNALQCVMHSRRCRGCSLYTKSTARVPARPLSAVRMHALVLWMRITTPLVTAWLLQWCRVHVSTCSHASRAMPVPVPGRAHTDRDILRVAARAKKKIASSSRAESGPWPAVGRAVRSVRSVLRLRGMWGRIFAGCTALLCGGGAVWCASIGSVGMLHFHL